jgi:hypothetical protein
MLTRLSSLWEILEAGRILCSLASSIGYSASPPSLKRRMYRGSHKEMCGLHRIPRYPWQPRRLENWSRDLLTQLRRETKELASRRADLNRCTNLIPSLLPHDLVQRSSIRRVLARSALRSSTVCNSWTFPASQTSSFGMRRPLYRGMVLSLFKTSVETIPCQHKKTRL